MTGDETLILLINFLKKLEEGYETLGTNDSMNSII
jgi:hypothetical protein